MRDPLHRSVVVVLLLIAAASLEARVVSRQTADAFARKIAVIRQQGEVAERVGMRRTPVTQDELNSWFMYLAQPVMPPGVAEPQVTIVGQGRVSGQATVDLEAIGKRRSSGGSFDPWNLVGGKVPITVAGILHTRDGQARFEVQSAAISGLPVSPAILQELVSFYSRTPERPQGVRIDDTFSLPANIRQIEVGEGQAIVVQ